MKKTIIIILVIIVTIFATFFSIPIFFKHNLLDATKSTINKNLDAEVEFSDLNLSFFRNFPKATLVLKNVVIVGKGEFQTDTLLNVNSVQATMSLASVFKKKGKSIEKIILTQPLFNFIVGESGNSNWQITGTDKPGSDGALNETQVNEGTENVFELQLKSIEVIDAQFVYYDKPAKMLVQLLGINLDVSGKMYGTTTQLEGNGKVAEFLLGYNNVEYISKTTLEIKSLLSVDHETMKISIIENELLVNRLPLEVTGNIDVPSDSMFFDLQIKTKASDFENFLALIPPVYEPYLENIKTSGSATISGSVSGLYFEDNYPAFSMDIDVKNGTVQYADLPEKIEKIRADAKISKPQGEINLTQIKVNEAHAEIKNSPVDLTLSLTNLVENLRFDGAFIGKVNFDDFKDVLPLDSINISGIIDANLFVKGNYSDIENESYENIKSDGIVLLDNFVYDSPKLTQRIIVPQGKLDFTPESIFLREFAMKIGQSDFKLTGKVSNYLNYLLKDGTISGELQLNSSLVNLNELLRLQVPENVDPVPNASAKPVKEVTSEIVDEEILAFNIPENIDFTFRSTIKNAVFDRLPISDINGMITARNGKLTMNGLDMRMLDGDLKLSGSYQNTPQNKPIFDFGFDVALFDIPTAYRTLTGIQKMLPVAARSNGKLSTVFKMSGNLSPNHKFIPGTINGNGLFNTKDLQIIGSPIFDQLKGILKAEKLQNVGIDDFKANFNIENGNIDLKPFKTKVAGQETTVYGALSAENLIDLRLDFKVNRDAFGTDIQNILSIIPGNEKILVLPAGVQINGPVGNPEVKMDLSETRKTITDATKGELQNSLEKLGKGLQKLFGN